MSNDVVMVAIPKELRDKIIESYVAMNDATGGMESGWLREELEALRAAPETVSLEGMEIMVIESLKKHGVTAYGTTYQGFDYDAVGYMVSADLRRLVGPVQPSAVASREAIERVYRETLEIADKRLQEEDLGDGDPFGWKRDQVCEKEAFDAVYALQLPQPVASVQPGAVVSRELWHASEIVLDAFKRRVSGHQLDYEMETLRIETLEQALLDSKNQHPQPVAPVQSGGVDSPAVELLRKFLYELSPLDADASEIEIEAIKKDWKWLSEEAEKLMSHLTTTQSAISVGSINMDEAVNRFLAWQLPKDFSPDCGIIYAPRNTDSPTYPIGTNLFTAIQAKEMLRHVLGIMDKS